MDGSCLIEFNHQLANRPYRRLITIAGGTDAGFGDDVTRGIERHASNLGAAQINADAHPSRRRCRLLWHQRRRKILDGRSDAARWDCDAVAAHSADATAASPVSSISAGVRCSGGMSALVANINNKLSSRVR